MHGNNVCLSVVALDKHRHKTATAFASLHLHSFDSTSSEAISMQLQMQLDSFRLKSGGPESDTNEPLAIASLRYRNPLTLIPSEHKLRTNVAQISTN